jgi:UDP:flavonoid glycosyltransferase YjiC (YdhE family)
MNRFHYELPQNITNLNAGAKILFACMAADGHFNPLSGLALHLQSLGYDVRWYVGNSYADKLKKMGIPHYPQRRAVDLTIENVNEFYPERETIKSGIAKFRFDLTYFFIKRAPDFYADLKEIHQSFPFEVVVADITFTAIPFITKKMHIPVIGIGIMPIAETSKDLPPMGLGMTPSTSLLGRAKQGVLRFVTDGILLRKPLQVLSEILAKEGLQRDGNLFDTAYRTSTVVLQSGTPSFEYKRSDLNPKIRFVGPLLPASVSKGKAPWHHEKLGQYKKVILVTQGTAEPDVEKLLVPTLEAFKNTDCLVVATTAGNKTSELRQRYPQANILIEDFIPFADIMPYAHVYVTNGGYGGVLLGIQHKLPMVAAGVNEGKNEICARIGYFKLGINLKTETPKPQQIKKSVDAILANGMYKENVKALAREFRKYNPQELCAACVEELLQSGTRRKNGTPVAIKM